MSRIIHNPGVQNASFMADTHYRTRTYFPYLRVVCIGLETVLKGGTTVWYVKKKVHGAERLETTAVIRTRPRSELLECSLVRCNSLRRMFESLRITVTCTALLSTSSLHGRPEVRGFSTNHAKRVPITRALSDLSIMDVVSHDGICVFRIKW